MTRKRVRAYATIAAVCLWSIWLADMSRPGPIDRLGKVKGTDFVHFYVLGSIARDGRWADLYDLRAQYSRTQAIVADAPVYLPIESPQTALLVAPLAALSFSAAFLVWTATIVGAYAGCCWFLWRECTPLHDRRYELIVAAVAFPGLFSVVLHGHTSFVALACVVASLAALRRDWRFAAGFALGLIVFKPHWWLAVAAVFLVAGEWRVVIAAVVAAAAETAVTFLAVGGSVMSAYWTALRTLPKIAALLEPRPGDSLKGLFHVLVPSERVALTLYVATALVTLILSARIWRSAAPFELRASSVLLATILVSPHVNSYDLVLLGPAVFLIASWLRESDEDPRPAALGWLLVALFIAPILVSLPAILRLQLSVTAMTAVLVVIWRIAERRHGRRPAALLHERSSCALACQTKLTSVIAARLW